MRDHIVEGSETVEKVLREDLLFSRRGLFRATGLAASAWMAGRLGFDPLAWADVGPSAALPRFGAENKARIVVDAAGHGDFRELLPAVAALPRTGGSIFIRPGNYLLKGKTRHENPAPGLEWWTTVPLPSNVEIVGSGPARTILHGSAADNTVILGAYGAAGIRLRGFTLAGGGNPGYGFGLFNCSESSVENVVVFGGPRARALNTGIGAYGRGNRFVGCRVFGARSIGFELGYGDDGTVVENCVARGCAVGLEFDGWETLPPSLRPPTPGNKNIVISNGHFTNNSNSGIILVFCRSAEVANCALAANKFYGLAVVGTEPGQWANEPSPSLPGGMNVQCRGLAVLRNGSGRPGDAGVWLEGNGSSVFNSVFAGNRPNGVRIQGQRLELVNLRFRESANCVLNSGARASTLRGCHRDLQSTQRGIFPNPSGLTVIGSPGF